MAQAEWVMLTSLHAEMILLVLTMVQRAELGALQPVSFGLSCVPFFVGYRLKESFLVTGSQDCTVKLWPLPEALPSKNTASDGDLIPLQAQSTQRCHDKVATTHGLWEGVWVSLWGDGYLSFPTCFHH